MSLLTPDKMIAEDITEETFYKGWRAIETCRGRENTFSSWLYRIAHNQVIDFFRLNPNLVALDPEAHADTSSPEREMEKKRSPQRRKGRKGNAKKSKKGKNQKPREVAFLCAPCVLCGDPFLSREESSVLSGHSWPRRYKPEKSKKNHRRARRGRREKTKRWDSQRKGQEIATD